MTSPEETELAAKRVDLERLSQMVSEKELDLEDLKLNVAQFQYRYFAEIGRRYAELDDLHAQLTELRARDRPADHALRNEAEIARERASKTAEEYGTRAGEPEPHSHNAEALEEIKRLYRRTAVVIHPDKATDDRSRHLRTKLMAELNEAYARRDIPRMQGIFAAWEESPDAVSGDGPGAELVRTIRAIAEVRRRMNEIESEVAEILASEIYLLMMKVHEAESAGRDILDEMAGTLDSEIETARAQIVNLRGSDA